MMVVPSWATIYNDLIERGVQV